MGFLRRLFGGFDPDIARHASSLYEDKRGTWNKMSHKDAERVAMARAHKLQSLRKQYGKRLHVTDNSYTIQNP